MSWHTNTNINTKIWKYSKRMGKKGSILDDDVCKRKINLQGYLVHPSFAERNVSVSVKRKWKPQELKRLKPSSPKYEGNIGGQTLLEFDVHSIFLTAALFLGTALLGYSLTTAFSAVWWRLSGQSLELAYLQMQNPIILMFASYMIVSLVGCIYWGEKEAEKCLFPVLVEPLYNTGSLYACSQRK